MYPTLEAIRNDCMVTDLEQRLLCSPQAPIVLMRRRTDLSPFVLAESVAPGNPYLGVMLPYTPLHHLLMAQVNFPVIATSGNLSDEPICIDEHEALIRLQEIADFFLIHNRPIARHLDDSIACVVMGREMLMRRARGYAPLPVHTKRPMTPCIALGAHLKNAVAMPVGDRVFVSQHIGDLETPKAFDAFERVIADFQNLYDVVPQKVVCDLHPSYFSTRYALRLGIPVVQIQHHYAHVLSCMAENHLEPPLLGVSWDGTGYGPDGTIWGGEFLKLDGDAFDRVAHLRTFLLPGGDKAIKEPRRSAIGLLYEIFGEKLGALDFLMPVKEFNNDEISVLLKMLRKQLNTFVTSSAGRLFDAVASILNVEQYNQFEGKAAMSLEFLANAARTNDHYPIRIIAPASPPASSGMAQNFAPPGPYIIDWEPMVKNILDDISRRISVETISAMFHHSLAEAIVMTAEKIGEKKVLLTGGCFQNRYLTEKTVSRLRDEGFQPYFHQRIPPNDGGISLGQAIGASLATQSTPSTSFPYE
jgi:hydrogenase maturation protein HypF